MIPMRPTVAAAATAPVLIRPSVTRRDPDVSYRSRPVSVLSRNGDRIAGGLQRDGEEGDPKVEKIGARLQRTLGDLVHLGIIQAR